MLIANIVARNEADRFLVDVLHHLRPIVDMIVFTDDCSTDSTPYIAANYGAKILQLEEPTFSTDEGKLRSMAWEHLSQYAQRGDWILAIDADERLYGTEHLRAFMDQSRYDVLGITFYHMWSPTHYRVDKAWKPTLSSRLFRYHEGGTWTDRHIACGSEPTYVQELIRKNKALWNTGLKMQHLGYVRDEDKIMKYNRYMQLDGGEFHARAHIESILDPHPHLKLWSPNGKN